MPKFVTRQTILRLLRQARDAALWRPSHARLLVDQAVHRARNQHAGYSDTEHLDAAAAWLGRAQDATGSGGVAGRYRLRSGWSAAYPETTGYIIPTFLALADQAGDDRFRDRAGRCVDFLLPLQLANGAFPAGELHDRSAAPSFFNTGQVLGGLVAWHRDSGDGRAIDAACRAADWLIGLQDDDGAFRRHLYHGVVTTYGAHASCWIAELGAHIGNVAYAQAARRHLEWVLAHRDRETGWIDLCGFSPEDHRARRSVTHTIAYTLWGLLATAEIVGDTEAVAAVVQAALAMARRLELSGVLPGVLDYRWRGAASFACLTGNAQMALVWFALFDRTGDSRFLNAALKAVDLVKRAQPMNSRNPGIRGGIPGSDPVWGEYIRMALPNWAAKFFIDALLMKQATMAALPQRPRGLAAPADGVSHTLPEVRVIAHDSPLRVVVLAAPSSKKVARMLREWEWGFRPAAVVVSLDRRRTTWERLRHRISEEGVVFRARRSPSRRPSAPGEHGATRGQDVRTCCREAGIPVIEVETLDSESAREAIRRLEPDLFVFAGGGILRPPLLAIPRLGTLNAHMGLLPFYRGMNVVEWARFHGDSVGCSVHLIDPGIDTGDILCVRRVPTDGSQSIEQLRRMVDEAQMALLGEVVRYAISSGALPPRRPQSPNEGRQFFRMHGDLRELLERELSAGIIGAPSIGERLSTVSV